MHVLLARHHAKVRLWSLALGSLDARRPLELAGIDMLLYRFIYAPSSLRRVYCVFTLKPSRYLPVPQLDDVDTGRSRAQIRQDYSSKKHATNTTVPLLLKKAPGVAQITSRFPRHVQVTRDHSRRHTLGPRPELICVRKETRSIT